MYDFDRGRHWSDVADDDGSSGMGVICMAYLDLHSCGSRDGGCHRSDVHLHGTEMRTSTRAQEDDEEATYGTVRGGMSYREVILKLTVFLKLISFSV